MSMKVVFRAILVIAAFAGSREAWAVEFERVVIDDRFPGAYQVEVADVDGDGKPDVVAVGGGTCAWYRNPSWTKRVVTGPAHTPGVISSATYDLDGDGKAEIAVAFNFEMNEPKRGKLLVAFQGRGLDDPWSKNLVGDIGSIHRLRWGDLDGDGRPELVVAPLFGPSATPPTFAEEPAHVVAFRPGPDPKAGRWARLKVGDAPVLHAIEVRDLGLGLGRAEILAANNLGVTRFRLVDPKDSTPKFASERLVDGKPGVAPKKGAGEVHLGRFKDGGRFLATVEGWHGSDVAIYRAKTVDPLAFGPREVVDDSLKEGHALWLADVDGDGDDEVFAGYRGPGASVIAYDWNGKSWNRTVVDSHIAAQDLRGGDLDGDGKPDVVAVGGSTHNVVWYRPRAPKP